MRIQSLLLIPFILASCSDNKSADTGPVSEKSSERPNTVVVIRADGGNIKTNLGYGIILNEKSGLKREWITAQDTLIPARLATTGIKTVYASRSSYSSGYEYRADVSIHALEPLSAIEVRFVLFDIWGEFLKTLSLTEVQDVPAGATVKFDPSWNLYSENEASEIYASIAYVARVRTQSGKIFEANYDPIVAEARKFSDRFTPEQLDPYRRPPRDSVRSVAGLN